NSWAYTPDSPWPDYDPAAAQALLTTVNLEAPADDGEAPAEEGETATAEDGENTAMTGAPEEFQRPASPFEFSLLVANNPALIALVNDIANAWGELGFTVRIEVADMTTLHNRLDTGNFDAALVEFSFAPNADPDPYVFWHQGQVGVGQNFGAMNDLRISEALEQARRETLGINRALLYTEFQELFAERAAALVLYYPLYTYGVDARLQGVQLGYLSSASDRFRTLRDWTFISAE
ncbi:MAG: hypothetical protein JXA10_13570, partial [Anaerolineae bacterium]|nr:hypothetical protein [Anaerolineae bacterium]